MPRLSRGCLRCRQRRVKCDEGRPSCRRCVDRDELCIGYRDESDLVFRHETGKTVDRARSSASGSSASSGRTRSSSVDSSTLSLSPAAKPTPVKGTPEETPPAAGDQAVARFFDKYVVYPCNEASNAGFLEHLPSLFKEVNIEGRYALRHAVQAAAFADCSQEAEPGEQLSQRALECYGAALAALGRSLSEKGKVPDDHDLMTVVVLDIFEVRCFNACVYLCACKVALT